MTNTQPQESHDNTNDDSTWSNAGKLSRKVRELAHRSYHALYPGSNRDDRLRSEPAEIAEDLRDLCEQVARLQQKIHARRLGALIPWVDALRQQVEDGLDQTGKRGAR